VIWVTQALRELDLITGKGQTLLVFLVVTGLSLPTLVAVTAPVALFIAVVYALNKLNGDSELVVMSAAGMPPRRVVRPLLSLGASVSVLLTVLSLYVMPSSFQELRDLITRVRADFVANIVKEGQFTTLDSGITFHFRERSGGALLGIFMEDRRDQDRNVVYNAERGQAVEIDGQSYLVLEKGSVHRHEPKSRDASIIKFERYAVDLAAFSPTGGGETVFKPRERSTTQLLFPDKEELYFKMQKGRFRAELHDRLSAWLYPLAIVFIAFAALGDPRTTRQGRGAAMAAAVAGVVALRVAGFAASGAAVRSSGAVVWMYGTPILAILICGAIAFHGPRLKAVCASMRERLAAVLPPFLPGIGRATP
jgi:lipopolysaccharide export system permease protein